MITNIDIVTLTVEYACIFFIRYDVGVTHVLLELRSLFIFNWMSKGSVCFVKLAKNTFVINECC